MNTMTSAAASATGDEASDRVHCSIRTRDKLVEFIFRLEKRLTL